MKLSLRGVRVCFGYTVEEVAEYCGISVKSLEAYEMDSGKMPINTALKVKKLYNHLLILSLLDRNPNVLNIIKMQLER